MTIENLQVISCSLIFFSHIHIQSHNKIIFKKWISRLKLSYIIIFVPINIYVLCVQSVKKDNHMYIHFFLSRYCLFLDYNYRIENVLFGNPAWPFTLIIHLKI